MSAGRPATPLHLKLLAGNPRKENLDKLADEMPDYPLMQLDDIIEPPDYLNELGKRTYIELAEKMAGQSVLTQMDDLALELLIESYQEFRDHQRFLEENGYTFETVDGNDNTVYKPYPENALKANAHKQVVSLLTQFGWTPSSRTKVKQIKAGADPIKGMGKRGK